MTLIDFKEQRGRCYESKQRWEYWSKLIAHQEKLIRDFIVKDDARFKYLITACERIYNSVTKSSSMVESVNAVIRRHLRCYKSVPQWFPNLFNEFWNNRKFERGKRKGFAPLELLTGKPPTGLWQDKILRDFPYHTISSSLPINPAYRPILKRDKSRFKELNKEDELYFLFKTKWCAKYLKSYYVSDEEFFADRERHNLAYNTELEKYQNIIAKTFEDRNMAVQTA